MIARCFLLGLFGLVLTFFAMASPAQAQATRTWVSGVGDDANPCSRTAPCKTFAGAISKTAAGGEINCIDPGGFGAVTIVKSMTIDCGFVEAGVLVAGTNGVIVNAAATDVVVLRGLDFIGTVTVPGLNGIQFLAGGALYVEKCLIREFTSAAPNGNGILFRPSTASAMFVSDTMINSNTGSAIAVRPTGTGSATVSILQTKAVGNGSGYVADTLTGPTTGNVNMTVRESIASINSTSGVSAVSGPASGNVGMLIDRTGLTLNGTGISATGSKSAILVGSSTIWANPTAGISQSGGGQIFSFGNNQVSNVVNGTFTPPVISQQ